MVELAATLFVIIVLGLALIFVGSLTLGGAVWMIERTGRFISSEKHVLSWIAVVGTGLVIIALLTRTALGEPNITILKVNPNQPVVVVPKSDLILPPVEYDHPYKGKLTVETVATRAQLQGVCAAAQAWSLACAFPSADFSSCRIVIVDDKIIREMGWWREAIMRHEIGHCNGWGSDHRGQRLWSTK
jgi:hypothetical protein